VRYRGPLACAEYSINEAALIFVRGGLELPNGEVVGDLIVSQPEFVDYERRGTEVRNATTGLC
jgi:hypothetical protein